MKTVRRRLFWVLAALTLPSAAFAASVAVEPGLRDGLISVQEKAQKVETPEELDPLVPLKPRKPPEEPVLRKDPPPAPAAPAKPMPRLIPWWEIFPDAFQIAGPAGSEERAPQAIFVVSAPVAAPQALRRVRLKGFRRRR